MSPRKQKQISHKPAAKTQQKPAPAKTTVHKPLAENNLKNKWIPYIALFILTVLAYALSFNTDFIYNWDDAGYVTGSEFVKSLSFENIKNIFSEINYMSNYHPLTTLSYAVDWQIAGEHTAWYHFVNLLFHLANSMLVFILIKRFFKTQNDWIPFFVAAVFALHPMHVESVAWISERKDVMYTFFFLLATIKYIDYTEAERGKLKQYLLMLLLFVCSLMSKSAAVVFPVSLFLFDWYRRRKLDLMLVAEKIPMLALSVLFGLIALKSQAEAMQDLAPLLTLTERLQIVNHSLLTYIYKFALPIKLSGYYPYPIKDNNALPVIYSIAPFITLVLAGIVAWFGRKNRELLFGIAFFLINLALVLQLKPVGGAVLAERYTYVPYIGLAVPFAFWLGRNATQQQIRKLVIGGIVLVFAIMSFMRVPVWKNGDTLFTNVLEQFPRNPYAWDNRGGLYWDVYASKKYKDNPIKRMEYANKAEHDFTQALSLDASYVLPWAHRGILYFNTGRPELALFDFNKALELDPAYNDALIGRANTLGELGKKQDSVANEYRNRNDLKTAEAYARKAQEFFGKSIPDYSTYLKQNPKDTAAWLWRATAYRNIRQYDQSNADLQQAVRINPRYAEAYYFMGLNELDRGRIEPAVQHFDKAIQINPGYQIVYFWKGKAYLTAKQYQKAIENFTQAIQLNPSDPYSLINRAVCYYNLDDYAKAAADLEAAKKTGYPVNDIFYQAVLHRDASWKGKL